MSTSQPGSLSSVAPTGDSTLESRGAVDTIPSTSTSTSASNPSSSTGGLAPQMSPLSPINLNLGSRPTGTDAYVHQRRIPAGGTGDLLAPPLSQILSEIHREQHVAS